MRKILVIIICIILSGCSSAGKSIAAKRPGAGEALSLYALSESEKARLYKKVREQPVAAEIDIFSRNLTLTALARAGSQPFKKADADDYGFNKIDLGKIKTEDLDHKYRILSKLVYEKKIKPPSDPDYVDGKGMSFWFYDHKDSAEYSDSYDHENSVAVIDIIRLTALYSVGNELERRGDKSEFWKGVRCAASRTSGIAIQLGLTLAKYMI
jgi:hypothetical protein